MSRIEGEAERASRDQAGMEDVYPSLKRVVEVDTKVFTARLLQARLLDEDAKW